MPFNIHSPADGINYATVAASQTAQALTPQGSGGVGGSGDYLAGLLVVPATTAPGTITVADGTLSAITVFATGTLPSTLSFFIPFGACSTTGAWKVTTGANVSVVAFGQFS